MTEEKKPQEKKLPELTVEEVSAAVESALENIDGENGFEVNIIAC